MKFIHIIIVFLLLNGFSNAQTTEPELSILLYNVENLFDIYNDSLKRDDEFTPQGLKHWNYSKYQKKLRNISRVIYESGKWNPPFAIGLCEIENIKVLTDLVAKTGLDNLNYKIIHFESPDQRGIDVAMLYRSDIFKPIKSNAITVKLGENSRPTRDILHVYGHLKKIPIHLIVCHFPSRYGGVAETMSLRQKAANILVGIFNDIQKNEPNANIIAMGDFNDGPEDDSMMSIVNNNNITNVMEKPNSIGGSPGTLKHRFEWNIFDQFFISNNLLSKDNAIYTNKQATILDYDFLKETDKNFSGKKPFRTYIGMKFNDGFSDHFPVKLNIYMNKK